MLALAEAEGYETLATEYKGFEVFLETHFRKPITENIDGIGLLDIERSKKVGDVGKKNQNLEYQFFREFKGRFPLCPKLLFSSEHV